MCYRKDIVVILIIVIIGMIFYSWYGREDFDEAGIAVTRYGDVKYDLKGDRTNVRNVTNCYYDKRMCYDDTFGNTEHNTYGGRGIGR